MADPAAELPISQLHLDTVTGEMVSKSELKRRQKQYKKDAEKAEKKAAAGSSANAGASSSAAAESELSPEQYYENRSALIRSLRDPTDPAKTPYVYKFDENYSTMDKFEDEFGYLKNGESVKDKEIRVAGRIFGKRRAGAKLIFYDVRQDNARFQVMCQQQESREGAPAFEKQHENLARGDIIGIIGYPGRTNPRNKQESGALASLSLFATEVRLLTPCLHIIPSEHFGLKDHDSTYRNRSLAFLMNKSLREPLVARAHIIRYIRNFFEDRDFLEVQTPLMSGVAGGATAKPFITHHNDLDMQMYMRIAPELYLKKLVVGGFRRVFEIGSQFRNEDMDLTHNPEFTTCEFYCAGFDYYDIMSLTEELCSGLVKSLTGGYITKFHTQHGEEYEVNWEAPWRRVEMMPALEEACGEKFPDSSELHTAETGEFLKRILKKKGVECSPPLTNARMLDKLVGEFIEETCVSPTFILDHPQMMSPLAKAHRSKPGLTERFETFVCKKEICNAYTELNDPFDQRERFEEQARQKDMGDDEAQLIDEDFIRALEYGLPPTGGWGLGIDRLVMFLTDRYTIRDVLCFPMMRPEPNAGK